MGEEHQNGCGFFTRLFGHIRTILRHKRYVRRYCFRIGLYGQGIRHDWSKYSPTEFCTGVRYYNGNFSPNRTEKERYGYSKAWLHHKGRNKHHPEYWIDNALEGDHKMCGMEMPYRYVAEMFCDRVAACRNYHRENYTDADAWEYYCHSADHYMLHPKTRAQLEELLRMLKEKGEDATFSYLKEQVERFKREKQD